MKILKTTLMASALMLSATSAFAADYDGAIKGHIDSVAKAWVANPVVINAIKAQNAKHAGLNEEAIIALDKKWRAETKASSRPMIDGVLANDVSQYLDGVVAEHEGLYTEVFVMDNKGLNVGQNDLTSDYWQGDEGKFKKSFGAGENGVFVDEVEFDDSSQSFQSQASFTIVDPADGSAIGAITIGINVDGL